MYNNGYLNEERVPNSNNSIGYGFPGQSNAQSPQPPPDYGNVVQLSKYTSY